ncbi:hypothetical protein RRG08_044597 [Elysia crispata]|uniref:Uncharacterized protein n=1 Tax=Elysia crispata TaxID=231223 RepID=A0AAE0YMJ5_9GAST|nr:hypothetical protein RRG08_044597 [Elysia crispata]
MPRLWKHFGTFMYAITGLVFQTLAVCSGSWLTVSHFHSGYRTCDLNDPERTRSSPSTSGSSCWTQSYKWVQVSSVGLWGVCFTSTYQPNDAFVPYCSDFVDDVVPAPWLTLLQTGLLLSPFLAALGLLFLTSVRLKRWREDFTVEWLAFKLLTVSGLCGVAACGAFVALMTPEFLSSYEPIFVYLGQDWALYLYTYGSLLHLWGSIGGATYTAAGKSLKIV